MSVFNEIHFRNLHGDIFGGVTAAVIALPMALAFGVASGAGAEVGLYGAIMVGLFAALFGGSPALISEPTGPMTVVFTAVFAKLIASNPESGLSMAFTVVVMAGFFQILFGVLKLGKYVTIMPYSVVSGFMSGIGIILIVFQFGPLMGQATPGGGALGVLESLPALVAGIRMPEFLLGVMTVGILLFMPGRMKRFVPPQLLALVVGTLVSIWLLAGDDLRRIGEIPSGLPAFQMPVFSIEQWKVMLLNAIVLGMLGSIDALLTSVIADSLTRQRHNSDKELIGQGVGNMMSGLFGGMPGAGATMGTVVNIQAGARTALSGLVRVAILVMIVMWMSGVTAVIPLAVLAGIAFKVGIDIVDWGFLKRAHLLSFKGALITYAVILLTVFVDLIVAVGIGLFIANVMTITRLSELQEADVEVIDSTQKVGDSLTAYEKDLLETTGGKLVMLLLKGAMIFGVSRAISRKNSEVQGCTLLIDISKVTHLGLSSSLAIEASIRDMLDAGKQVFVVHAEGQPVDRLQKMGILDRVPDRQIVNDRRKAMERAIYGKDDSPEEGSSPADKLPDSKNPATGE